MPKLLRRLSKKSLAVEVGRHLLPKARTHVPPLALHDVQERKAVIASRAKLIRERAAVDRENAVAECNSRQC